MKKTNLDMTEGSPLKLLTLFTLPTLASNLLNQVYTITDSLIVGRYLGQTALAAVGVCMPIILLISAMVVGLNVGVGIVLSHCFGRRDMDAVRHTLANAAYLGLAIAAVLAVVGVPIAQPLLRLIGTPEGPMREAVAYMRITFATTIFPIFYYMFSNAYRGIGDAYTALHCLIVSVVGNIALDYLFVAKFHFGVAGSAYATAIARGMSVIFAAVMLYIKYPQMRTGPDDLRPDGRIFRQVTSLALPIAIQAGFNNLGNVVVQSCINGFGEAIMASYTVGSRLGAFALMPMETIGSSLSVFAGQNLGAKRYARINQGVKASFVINLITSVILSSTLLIFGRPLILLFLSEATGEIVNAAQRYLCFAAVPGFFYGVMYIYQHVLRGIGHAKYSMAGSFMQLGAKVVVAVCGAMVLRNLDVVWLAWPVSYLVGTICPCLHYYHCIHSLESLS